MPIAVSCPACSANFTAKDEHAGKQAKCPKCGGPITIPSQYHYGDTVRLPQSPLKRPPDDQPPPAEPTE